MEKNSLKKLQIKNLEMTAEVVTSLAVIQETICVIRNYIDIQFINSRS